jgi:glycosyltransferase involved in cell wall biosynthesis
MAAPRALVLHVWLRPCSGSERACLEFIRVLTGLGYRVSLLSLDTPADLEEVARHLPGHAATLAGVTPCPVPGPVRRGLRRLGLRSRFLGYGLLCLVFLARSGRYELLLSTWGEIGLPRPLAARRAAGRCFAYINFPLFSLDGEDRLALSRHGRGRLRTLATDLAVRLMRRVLGLARMHATTVVMANSDWTARRTARLYPGLRGVHVVYGPVAPPPAPAQPAAPRPSRRRGGAAGQPWRFVCLGRIIPIKRQAMLARCLQGLFAGRGDDFALTIVGYASPAHLEPLRREFARDPRVVLRPNAGEAEVAGLLAEADFGLHGHPCEHFGLAVAQMVDAGLPVFVPRDGGQAEIVPVPELQYGDPAELAARIAAVLDDDALRRRVEAEVAALAGRFTAERFAARVAAVLRDEAAPGAAA